MSQIGYLIFDKFRCIVKPLFMVSGEHDSGNLANRYGHEGLPSGVLRFLKERPDLLDLPRASAAYMMAREIRLAGIRVNDRLHELGEKSGFTKMSRFERYIAGVFMVQTAFAVLFEAADFALKLSRMRQNNLRR